MKDNYELYMSIITRCRDCSELTSNVVAKVIGTDNRRAAMHLRKMLDIGCVKITGRRECPRYHYHSPIYQFDEFAVTRLKSRFFDEKIDTYESVREVKEHVPRARPRRYPFEEGFGRSRINALDAMLQGVRCEMRNV